MDIAQLDSLTVPIPAARSSRPNGPLIAQRVYRRVSSTIHDIKSVVTMTTRPLRSVGVRMYARWPSS